MKKNLIALALLFMMGFGFSACNQEGSADTDTAAAGNATASTTTATTTNTPPPPPAANKATTPEVDPNEPKTTVDFDKTVVDFGTITQGDKVSDVVKITNTGNEPLIIKSAKGSCGCTVPQWPKEPIAPGESGEINIEFSSKGKKGKTTKTVTIQANTDPNPTRLTVKADILVPDDAAAGQ